jgi:hypothetical protein
MSIELGSRCILFFVFWMGLRSLYRDDDSFLHLSTGDNSCFGSHREGRVILDRTREKSRYLSDIGSFCSEEMWLLEFSEMFLHRKDVELTASRVELLRETSTVK